MLRCLRFRAGRVLLAALGLIAEPARGQPAPPMPPLPSPPPLAPAPAPAAPAGPGSSPDRGAAVPAEPRPSDPSALDDFSGPAVVHRELIEPDSPLTYACSQARVWVTSRDALRACYRDAPAQALALLTAASEKLLEEGCTANAAVARDDAERLRVAALEAYERVVFASKSPEGFARFLESPAQQAACSRLLDSTLAAGTDAELVPERQASIDASRRRAHSTDLLRKASTTLTGMITGNGQTEAPGSPDVLAVALMTALGADRETTGSHLVLTLNLAALVAEQTEQRLELPAPLRGAFLRLSAPLESTQAAPAAGELASDTLSSGRRISAVLGTSLIDSSDPRLKKHEPCYRKVLDYLPPATTLSGEEHRRRERELYFDACHRRAAYEQRLALRAGVSLFTSDDAQNPETFAEMWAGALVYAPVPWLYTNAIYQRVVEPSSAHVVGAGVSLAGNVGGPASGVSAWGRFGIDTLFLLAKPDDLEGWGWEWRIVPTIKAKLGDNVTQLGIGPRIVENGDTGLFATVSLTYDADNLIDPLITASP